MLRVVDYVYRKLAKKVKHTNYENKWSTSPDLPFWWRQGNQQQTAALPYSLNVRKWATFPSTHVQWGFWSHKGRAGKVAAVMVSGWRLALLCLGDGLSCPWGTVPRGTESHNLHTAGGSWSQPSLDLCQMQRWGKNQLWLCFLSLLQDLRPDVSLY